MARRALGSILVFGLALGVSACGSDDGDASGTASTGTTANDNSSSESGDDNEATSSSTTTSSGSETGDDETAATSSFVSGNDAASVAACDVWSQDCPEGEKCNPYAMSGSSWDATKCVPVDATAAEVGDVCEAPSGGTSGEDNCVKGAFCDGVDDMNQGTCMALCSGSATAPTCPPGFVCSINNDGVLNLCEQACDPILHDCDGERVCIAAPNGNNFTCAPGWGDGAIENGEACTYVNSCQPSHYCALAASVPNCDAENCCTPVCDIEAATSGCDATQECIPWFDTDVPGYEKVGACQIPM